MNVHLCCLPVLGLTLALTAGCARAEPSVSTEAARAAIAESSNAIFQGDAGRALQALTAVADAQFAADDARHRACVLGRLQAEPGVDDEVDSADPFIRRLLAQYRRYWWKALSAPDRRADHEAALRHGLATLLGREPVDDMATLEAALQEELRRRGHHGLFGRTPPLRELMLWRTQTSREEAVALPEGEHQVRIELLDDFVSLGWSAWALCERSATGGWATRDALFAVVPRYKDGLDSEAFRVVFLAHEAQHFADKQRWPGLAAWELEYRAKLVELAMAGQELASKRLTGFSQSQSDDLDSPHTYANKRVVAALAVRLGQPPTEASAAALKDAALAALTDDTRQREAAAAVPDSRGD